MRRIMHQISSKIGRKIERSLQVTGRIPKTMNLDHFDEVSGDGSCKEAVVLLIHSAAVMT
jgi:hypothetical protein